MILKKIKKFKKFPKINQYMHEQIIRRGPRGPGSQRLSQVWRRSDARLDHRNFGKIYREKALHEYTVLRHAKESRRDDGNPVTSQAFINSTGNTHNASI